MAKILNILLCTATTFLLCFAWAALCLKNTTYAFWAAAIVAVCSCYIFFVVFAKRHKSQAQKTKRKKQLQSLFAFLQFEPDCAAVFAPMLQFFHFEVQQNFDSAIVTKQHTTYCAFCFEKEVVDATQVRRTIVLAKRCNCDSALIFCNKADAAARKMSSNFNCRFVDMENTYALFEQSEKLPNLPKQKSMVPHIVAQVMFNRKRFGWYLFSALFTLLTAVFSLIKWYLLGWATVLFGCALYCLFNTRFNHIATQVSLD